MKLFLNIIIVFISSFSANAQKIKGKIIDENQAPIDFATVILQTKDSIYVNAVCTDSAGNFTFNEDIESFRLTVQHLMYEAEEKEYTNQNAGSIIMKRKDYLLNEVLVTGKRPLVEVSDGKLSYNVPLLINNKPVSNAYEVLLELPGVREEGGEYLTFTGTNSLSIILNGKPSTMSYSQLIELLKNTPSSIIEKAEIMYVPPPQYHVKGAAINLIIKKNHFENLFGQANIGYDQQYYDNYKTGASLFYSNSKIYHY
ncbi:MAG: TonB-dependent receptor [Dysgonamonadaceae bacterium]|jgi:hypothetical protein|nr:TonB-dependent receptor [Dysgonamonadaceae bacterium]